MHEQGLPVAAIARATGLSEDQVVDRRRGRGLSPADLLALAAALRVQPVELLVDPTCPWDWSWLPGAGGRHISSAEAVSALAGDEALCRMFGPGIAQALGALERAEAVARKRAEMSASGADEVELREEAQELANAFRRLKYFEQSLPLSAAHRRADPDSDSVASFLRRYHDVQAATAAVVSEYKESGALDLEPWDDLWALGEYFPYATMPGLKKDGWPMPRA